MKQHDDARGLAYDPLTASNLAIQMIDNLRKDAGGGIRAGITDMDKQLLPLRPGELITVLGYTSHYKSGFMNWLSKQALKTILPESHEIVIRVTWEQSVEEDTLSWLAGKADLSITNLARGLITEDEWKILDKAGYDRAATPMWIVGHSSQESRDRRKARPRMTIRDVAYAIEYILHDATEYQLSTKMIVLDYLQRIRPDPQDGNTKREQQMEAVNLSKDLAVSYGCPVVLGVQTGRDILQREDKMPRIDDGQETSNVEQSSDKMIGCWYPIKTEDPGSKVDGYKVNQNLLFVRILKQKLGPAPLTYALYVDPEKNELGKMTREETDTRKVYGRDY